MSAFPHRPFRFGIQASKAPDRGSWVDLARSAEDLGYDVLTMPDHFTDQLAPVPALMTAADVTSRLRVGALVWDNDYKHPVVFAKEMATMDVLSDGRLEIGIGAGWMRSDYEQSGIPYDTAGVRIDRFIEGLEIIRGVMGDGPFSFSGTHYAIDNYEGHPKPVQRPCPPVLIGGGGPRVLRFAARHAEIVGINGTMAAGVVGREAIESMTAEAVEHKVALVAEAASEAGRIEQIEMNIRAFFVQVTDDRRGGIDAMASFVRVEPTMIEETPFALVGSTETIVEDLLARRERWGFSYVIVGQEDVRSFAPVVATLAGR